MNKENKEEDKKEKIEAQSVQFSPLREEISPQKENSIEMLFDIPLQITAELGRTTMSIQEILKLSSGSIIELNKLAGEPSELLVNGKLIAKGEVVVVDESFGIRITEIIGPKERIKKLQ